MAHLHQQELSQNHPDHRTGHYSAAPEVAGYFVDTPAADHNPAEADCNSVESVLTAGNADGTADSMAGCYADWLGDEDCSE